MNVKYSVYSNDIDAEACFNPINNAFDNYLNKYRNGVVLLPLKFYNEKQ